jgi:hypothetical protein
MSGEDPPRDDEWLDREQIIAEIAVENRDSLERIAEGDDKWASLARRILQEGDDER